MNRTLVYPSEQPTDSLWLTAEKNKMIAQGWLSQTVLGVNTVCDGLSCIPTVPASLAVQILPGVLYALAQVDSTPYGSLPADAVTQIVKQGLLLTTTNLTLTPPATAGQAINYLIQGEFSEVDGDPTVLSYFNSDNPSVPFTGPGGSGISQPTSRKCLITLQAKAGVAATAGTQVTPAPDAGFTGLWVVTVAQGATALTGAQITRYVSAPFIDLKLPQVPAWVQGGTYAYADDSSLVANQIVVTLNPVPTTMAAGFVIRGKKNALPNSGAMTIILKDTTGATIFGPYAIIQPTGSALAAGNMPGLFRYDLEFDGTSFSFANMPTSIGVGSLAASSGEGITVSGGGVVSLNFPGLANEPAFLATDLFAFYSTADSHHRTMTQAQFLAWLNSHITFPPNAPHGPGTQVGQWVTTLISVIGVGTPATAGLVLGNTYPASQLSNGNYTGANSNLYGTYGVNGITTGYGANWTVMPVAAINGAMTGTWQLMGWCIMPSAYWTNYLLFWVRVA